MQGAQEGKGVAGKSHRVSSANERHPSQDLGVAAKSSQGRRLQQLLIYVKHAQIHEAELAQSFLSFNAIRFAERK